MPRPNASKLTPIQVVVLGILAGIFCAAIGLFLAVASDSERLIIDTLGVSVGLKTSPGPSESSSGTPRAIDREVIETSTPNRNLPATFYCDELRARLSGFGHDFIWDRDSEGFYGLARAAGGSVKNVSCEGGLTSPVEQLGIVVALGSAEAGGRAGREFFNFVEDAGVPSSVSSFAIEQLEEKMPSILASDDSVLIAHGQWLIKYDYLPESQVLSIQLFPP